LEDYFASENAGFITIKSLNYLKMDKKRLQNNLTL